MRAMVLTAIEPLAPGSSPLHLANLPIPEPGPHEVRLRVSACGVCHTELDEIEGRVATARLPIVLGHEAVGYVDRLGAGVTRHRLGDRVGTIRRAVRMRICTPTFAPRTGDVDGGYAEYMTVPEASSMRSAKRTATGTRWRRSVTRSTSGSRRRSRPWRTSRDPLCDLKLGAFRGAKVPTMDARI
jgi:D-arabinose 1-dehydrogenase-like Zn-dependent alcohol dehydrogenase